MKKYVRLMLSLLLMILAFAIPAISYAKSEDVQISSEVNSELQAKFVEPKVSDQKKFGNLIVLHLAVKGADHSDAFAIVTPQNKVINIDDYAILSSIDIKKSANFSELAKNYPNIDSLWPGNHQYPESVTLPGGIQQLQFTYSVLNGCHACAIGAIAKVGFNFDADGNFLGTTLLGLSPPSVVSN